MFVRQINNTSHLCIYAYNADAKIQDKIIKQKRIANFQVLTAAATGHGKSVCANTLAWELKMHGYTVIYLTEKQDNELDNAFFSFPAYDDTQLATMNRRNIQNMTMDEARQLVKIYHPFTFDIVKMAKKKNPPINFFTLSLKETSELGMSVLLVRDVDKESVRTCTQLLQQLAPGDNIWDFLNKLTDRIQQDEREYSYSPQNMFVPVKGSSTKRTLSWVLDSFSPLREHFFLQADNFPHNLNFLELINDQEHIHVFTYKWLKDARLRYFAIIEILKRIQNAMSDRQHVKFPIVIVAEELKALIPQHAKLSFQTALRDEIEILLNSIRAKGKGGCTISTTQAYFQTDEFIRGAGSEHFLGKLSPEDEERLVTRHNFKQADIDLIRELQPGEFIWRSDLFSGAGTKFSIHPGPFAFAQEGENYFDAYKDHYPEMMRTHQDVYDEMWAHRKGIEDRMKKQLREKEVAERAREKEKNKRTEKEELGVTIVEEKKKVATIMTRVSRKAEKEALKVKVYESCRKEPSLSWGERAAQFKLSIVTAQKYAAEIAVKVKDNELLKQLGWK